MQNNCIIRLKLIQADQPFISVGGTPTPQEAPAQPTATPTPPENPVDSIPYGGPGYPIR